MLDYRWIIANIGAIQVKLVELTAENIDDVLKQLHKAGYLAGPSNYDDGAIYFSKTGGMFEPNKTYIGELLVVDGNEWIPLRKKEFSLSDDNIRKAIESGYRGDKK